MSTVAPHKGLSSAEAEGRLATYGPNVISDKKFTAFGVLLRQLKNPILIMLLVAAAISGVLGDAANAIEISIIVLLSVGLSFFTEFRAEQANADLHSRVSHSATVYRDGIAVSLAVTELVPGDIVKLAIGSIVPADLKLTECNELLCDESVITGESIPIEKKAGDSALMGTVVKSGAGEAEVILTGPRTQFGVIAARLGDRVPETDFQRGLSRFSVFLLRIAISTTVLVMIVNLFFKPGQYNFSSPSNLVNLVLYALALAVGMTPQLLPAIVSTALALGSRQLAKAGVLVKRLVSIEDLGDLDVLLTDKTGTLTAGAVALEGAESFGAEDVELLGLLCTDADYSEAIGSTAGLNPLDAALWANRNGVAIPGDISKIDSIPFDHNRRVATALVQFADRKLLITKGSPEDVFAKSRSVSEAAQQKLSELYARGARVIAVATKPGGSLAKLSLQDETDLELQGFLVFSDPPKQDVQASLQELRKLGIDVKIATGDSAEVAVAVCRSVGIEIGDVITGTELAQIAERDLADRVSRATIFARVSPEQKALILKALRSTGKSIGFLGDGVNDAIALHDADVGISVDTATDVAKDAADVVLLEKDLGVLARGVSHGRKVFNNTMKYVLMGTAGDFGNLFSAALGTMVLPFLPMAPGQVLLQDLMYDSSQLAIPTDNVDPEQVARPSHWRISYIRKFMLVFGLASSLFDFMTFGLMLFVFHAKENEFHTGWFVESLATATLIGFAIRTRRVPFFRSRPSLGLLASISLIVGLGSWLPYSPLSSALGFTPLPPLFFFALAAMVAGYMVLAEIAKLRLFRQDATAQSERTEIHSHKHFQRRASKFRMHRKASSSARPARQNGARALAK